MAKGVLSEADKAAMKIFTRDAASALVDDLQHIRAIIAKETPDAGDIRRLSNQLRRLIVEGDLRTVAAPRIGRVEIIAPDLNSIYRSNDKTPFLFMSADEVKLCGVIASTLCFEEDHKARDLPDFEPGARVRLRLEAFQNQRVLCFRGKWVSRGDIIKYVANVAHGVHTTDPKEPAYLLLRKIRHACFMFDTVHPPTGEAAAGISFNLQALADVDLPIEVDPKRLDLVLMHLISTAQYLTAADDVIALEADIVTSG